MRTPLRFAIFIGIILVILGMANTVVYAGLTLTFGVNSSLASYLLAGFLAFMSLGFIGMTILGSYYYNAFTRWGYRTVAIWMGVFAYFFFASVVLGLAALFGEIIKHALPYETIGTGLYAAAILVGVYGIVHARIIRVTRYNVALPNLPQAWVGKQAVWMSDLHLGQLHGAKFAAKVVRAVMALKPAVIFIGGDLYDGTGAPDAYELAEPLAALTAPLGVYYITGNHEEFGDNKKFLDAVSRADIRVLMDETVSVEGVDIVGVDYQHANDAGRFRDILSSQSLSHERPSILLKHEPNHLQISAKAGVSLQISGHTHYGQQWPFGLVAQLAYQGYAYGLKPFESMQMLTSSGVGTWGPPVRVGSDSEIVLITFI